MWYDFFFNLNNNLRVPKCKQKLKTKFLRRKVSKIILNNGNKITIC